MAFLAELTAADVATLTMSALGLAGGAISTVIAISAKRYEDQRQLRMTVGDYVQKILALRAEEERLNVKALHGEEGLTEFRVARDANLRSQLALARLATEALDELKREASATEYEVLATALTMHADPAADRLWRLAISRARDTTARISVAGQFAYALVRYGRAADGEREFENALKLAAGNPVNEGYVHDTHARALHAATKHTAAKAAFGRAEAAYARIADEGLRDTYLKALAATRQTLAV